VVSGAPAFGVDERVHFTLDLGRISLFDRISEQRL